MPLRIASLLPAATEIAAALGLGGSLVAVSHACDHPRDAVEGRPRVTSSLLPSGIDQARIDAAVAAAAGSGQSLHRVDLDRLAALRPDLLLTQDLCGVCAVPDRELGEALRLLRDAAPGLRTVRLSGGSFAGILEDIRKVAEAAGCPRRGAALAARLEARWAAIPRQPAPSPRPRVAVLEWPDPPFSAGHWVPEQVRAAGGVEVLAEAGAPSRRLDWGELAAAEPEVIVSAACGYGLEANLAFARALAARPELASTPAVRTGRLHAVDANACFSRPGPRVVEGAEVLADLLRRPCRGGRSRAREGSSERLGQRLPEYMVPAAYVLLERMPLTTNGKIDRRALPDPPAERPPLAQAYEPPQGPLEAWIAERWSGLLQVHPVGRRDKFFELGGHSLLAARFLAELQEALGASVFITTIFDHPDVASYAAMLQREYPDEVEALFAERQKTERGAAKSGPATERLQPDQVAAFAKYLPHYPAPAIRPERKGGKAVFILAPPRSGTTLLRAMLAGHPQLFAANELQLMHFDTLAQRSQTYSGKFALWQEGLVRAVMELKGCDADEARAFLLEREGAGATTLDLWRWLEEASGRIVADKSPSYALDPQALRRMAEWFEDARFVHLVRHPWSVARSVLLSCLSGAAKKGS